MVWWLIILKHISVQVSEKSSHCKKKRKKKHTHIQMITTNNKQQQDENSPQHNLIPFWI